MAFVTIPFRLLGLELSSEKFPKLLASLHVQTLPLRKVTFRSLLYASHLRFKVHDLLISLGVGKKLKPEITDTRGTTTFSVYEASIILG
jgi:hypothetical protein